MERAQRRVRGAVDPPTCPRATQTFVGREDDLARFVELLDQAVLFMVYGVAGIGKSEGNGRLIPAETLYCTVW